MRSRHAMSNGQLCSNEGCNRLVACYYRIDRRRWAGLCSVCTRAFRLGQATGRAEIWPDSDLDEIGNRLAVQVILAPDLPIDTWYLVVPQRSPEAQYVGRDVYVSLLRSKGENDGREQKEPARPAIDRS